MASKSGCCRVRRSSVLILATDLERAVNVLSSRSDDELRKTLDVPRIKSALSLLREQLSRINRISAEKEEK